MKLNQDIVVNGVTIPKGTVLKVSIENEVVHVSSELAVDVDLYRIPTSVIDMDDQDYNNVNVNANKLGVGQPKLSFQNVNPGDSGFDPNGRPITIIEKFDFLDKPFEAMSFIESLDVDYENAYIYQDDMSGKAMQIVLVSNGSSLFLYPFDDVTIFKINEYDFDSLEVNDEIFVSNESYRLVGKYRGRGPRPIWAKESGQQVLLKNSRGLHALKITDIQ